MISLHFKFTKIFFKDECNKRMKKMSQQIKLIRPTVLFSYQKNSEGLVLLELILVIVIAASIILLGIRQYYQYRFQTDIYQIQANVTTLFRAMGKYYRAQCYGTIDPNSGQALPGTGLLRTSTTTPLPINITTDLHDNGYLTDVMQYTPLLDTTAGTGGYIAQFNRYTERVEKGTGTTVIWKAQISVKLADNTNNTQYLALLGGDCLSTASGQTVLPCPGDPAGDVVVWERLPSASAMINPDNNWTSMPNVQQFSNMYREYSDNYLLNVSHTPEVQYYYCGGGY